MRTSGEFGGAQLAQQCAATSSLNHQTNQMQDIQINVKGCKFRLKCSSLNEEKKGKDEKTQENQPKRKKYASDHGKVHLPTFAPSKRISS